MRVPVEVRGALADGTLVEESANTSVVGELGAMVLISKELPEGSMVEVTNRFSQRTARFRVAWVKDGHDGQVWETGLESIEPLDDFWGVRFPPKPSHS